MIKAITHSDDHVYDIEFDMIDWLKIASEEAIQDLRQCEYGGDYAADAIALYFEDFNREIKTMMSYVRSQTQCGFECHVIDTEALEEWIDKNRPNISINPNIIKQEKFLTECN